MQHGKALDQREPIEIIRDYSRWKAEKSLRKYFIYFIRVSYAYHTRILRESYANPTRITVIFVRRESGTETLAFIFLASSKPPEPSTIDGPRTFYSSGKNEITRIIRVYVGIYAFFFFSTQTNGSFHLSGAGVYFYPFFEKTSGKFLELKFSQSLWISSIVSPVGSPLDFPTRFWLI